MEKTNGIKRSETWNKIYNIVKTLPREKVLSDSPDAPSVTTSIEQLFLKLLPIHGVVKSLPSKEVINYLERQEDFYIDEDEIANRFYNAALNDVKYFIEKEEEKLK